MNHHRRHGRRRARTTRPLIGWLTMLAMLTISAAILWYTIKA